MLKSDDDDVMIDGSTSREGLGIQMGLGLDICERVGENMHA